MNPYFKDGLMTDILPYGTPENASLWTSTAHLLFKFLKIEQQANVEDLIEPLSYYNVKKALNSLTDGDKWYPLSDHSLLKEEGMSRDNKIGLSAFSMFYDNKDEMSKCGFTSILDFIRAPQPQDLIFFGMSAGYSWAKPLKSILIWNIKRSCKSQSQTGSGVLDTDGKILSFIRAFAMRDAELMFNITDLVYDSLFKYFYIDGNIVEYPFQNETFPLENEKDKIWRVIFAMYFKDANNPINRICNEMWGD